ncbi:hypothetical protein [Prosthecobacter sp.]|uniref:hypothetical protein n=1 Tax=Prosthecobacter sp. TaxID=1965333 RepID=UPI00378405B0
MKITVDELHQYTAKYVHLASHASIEVEDSGRLLAILQPPVQASSPTGSGIFLEREARICQMPLINIDSTEVISALRDADDRLWLNHLSPAPQP